MQEKEVKNNIVLTSGFGVRKTFKGRCDFDKYYVHKKVKQVIVKTGDSEDDFVIKNKVVVTKDDIEKIINAQASEVGIEAFTRSLRLQGLTEADLSANVSENVNDCTNAPNDLAEVAELGNKAQNAFAKLDPKLTKGLSLEAFLSSLSQDVLNDYFKSLLPKKEDKEVIKKEGE